jgi:hypothetical protein
MIVPENKISPVVSSSPNLATPKSQKKRISSLINLLIGCGFLAMIGILSSGVYWHLKRAKAQLADNSAYVELKLIDASGQAVAGARVFEADQPVGVTDSFGEWSKYGRFVLGETVQFRVTYRQDGKLQEVSRNFAMPLTSATQVKFQATLQFGARNPNQDSVGGKEQVESSEVSAVQMHSEQDQKSEGVQSGEAKLQDLAAEVSGANAAEVAANPAISNENGPVSEVTAAGKLSFLEQEGLKAEDQEIQTQLIEKVFPKIVSGFKSSVETSGLNLVTNLIGSSTGKPMLMVRVMDKQGKLLHGVVRGYEANVAQVLSLIRPPMQWLIENQGQFVAPRAGWPQQQLKILGKLENSDMVYVGGYLARPDAKSGSFSYFGESLKAMNVTVVRANQILHRARIVNRSWGNAAIVSLPNEDVARR